MIYNFHYIPESSLQLSNFSMESESKLDKILIVVGCHIMCVLGIGVLWGGSGILHNELLHWIPSSSATMATVSMVTMVIAMLAFLMGRQ